MKLWGHKTTKRDDYGQRAMIQESPDSRLMVEGGPGTGKTATACARAIHLIKNHGMAPSALLVVSFTRIAVREIAERIGAALDDAKIKVVTLDALATYLSPDREDSESHDDSIGFLITLLPRCPALLPLRHVIVDEAHDVVGVRADLVEAMIQALPQACGVTIFADPAQSIYDFADRSRLPKPPLPVRLVEAGMAVRPLTVLYRTADPALTPVFERARPVVLSQSQTPAEKFTALSRLLRRAAPRLSRLPVADLAATKSLILYRYRVDVLAASTLLAQQGIGHSLRMSGLPAALPAWIALCLSRHQEPTIGRARFLASWDRCVAGTFHAAIAPDDAWELLHRAAPLAAEVSLPTLRSKLMQASPPLDLCQAQLGLAGPILGTIHASKGREADDVILALSETINSSFSNEECRILFVGATRAKKSLRILSLQPLRSQILPSGRIVYPGTWAEIGLDQDISPDGLVAFPAFATPEQVLDAQQTLARLPPVPHAITLDRFHNIIIDKQSVGTLSSYAVCDFDAALPRVADGVRQGAAWMMGVRSLVFDPTDHRSLHAPWNDSGFALAPIIVGGCDMRKKAETHSVDQST